MVGEWVIVLITWYGTSIPLLKQEINTFGENDCNTRRANIEASFKSSDDPLLGYIIDCKFREREEMEEE